MSSSASPSSPSAHTHNTFHIPADLAFLFTIRALGPDYTVQPIQTSGQFWVPPNLHSAYQTKPETWYRWVGGRITRVANNESARLANCEVFAAATVFTQMPDTPHLLAVPFDAQNQDVRDYPPGWRTLSFHHFPVNGDARRTHAFITYLGSEARIAGPGSPHIVGPLLPSVYHYHHTIDGNNREIPSEKDHAGLIGNLPVLLALAAFSATPNLLDQTLTRSVLPGTWHPHSFPGGYFQERGMVVTVYLDPSRPKESTRPLLEHLQNGGFGPFYGL